MFTTSSQYARSGFAGQTANLILHRGQEHSPSQLSQPQASPSQLPRILPGSFTAASHMPTRPGNAQLPGSFPDAPITRECQFPGNFPCATAAPAQGPQLGVPHFEPRAKPLCFDAAAACRHADVSGGMRLPLQSSHIRHPNPSAASAYATPFGEPFTLVGSTGLRDRESCGDGRDCVCVCTTACESAVHDTSRHMLTTRWCTCFLSHPILLVPTCAVHKTACPLTAGWWFFVPYFLFLFFLMPVFSSAGEANVNVPNFVWLS